MLSPSDPMPLRPAFENFMYAYKITPTAEKGTQVINHLFKYLSNIDPAQIETPTKDYILKELLTIRAPFNPVPNAQVESQRDQIITHLFIRTLPLAENFPSLMISTLDRSILPRAHQEKLFQPFAEMLRYHSREQLLTLGRSQIAPLNDEQSELFWNTLRETFLAQKFETPRLEFIDENREIRYSAFALSGFFNTLPRFSSFGKEFTLIFIDDETLVETYEILLSCGKWFSAFFQAGLNDEKSQEIDFRPYAPNLFVFKQGFQELVARVKREKVTYPTSHLQRVALTAYFHLSSFFTHVFTEKEEAGREYLFKQFQNVRNSYECIGSARLNSNIEEAIQKTAFESDSLETLFEKLDPVHLALITSLTITSPQISLPAEICRFSELETIIFDVADTEALPVQIHKLEHLTSVEIKKHEGDRPFTLGEDFTAEIQQESSGWDSINRKPIYKPNPDHIIYKKKLPQ